MVKEEVEVGKLWWFVLVVIVVAPVAPAAAQDLPKFKLLATSRTGTMENELNEAGAQGYRFAGTQGGETAFGGREAVVVMQLDRDGRRFRYILLATSRTGTMENELNEAPPEFDFAGMTVFQSAFGGREAAVILEAVVDE